MNILFIGYKCPLLITDSPLVGTGMEKYVARDSGAVVISRNKGTVKYVVRKPDINAQSAKMTPIRIQNIHVDGCATL